MKYNKNNQGFTLVEVAVVLVIVGLLVGGFINTFSSRIEATRYAETKKGLGDIKQAILGYAYKNGSLPCPDTDGDGAMNCAAALNGYVPWETLGLGSGDAWDNRYEYWLDASFAVQFDIDTNLAIGGQLMMRSADGTTLEPLASNIVAVVFSRGKNGFGALGVDGRPKAPIPTTGHSDEDENGSGDNRFVSRSPTYEDDTTDVGTFDDQVIWISEFILKAKMVEAGVLPLPP